MTHTIDVSVIVPIYNLRRHVNACIQSLIAQTFAHHRFEIILLDDGSTDGTSELLDDLVGKLSQKPYSPSITLKHKESNTGLSDTRNIGVRLAQGRYITFVDGDDTVDSDYIATMWQALAQCAVGHPPTNADNDIVIVNGCLPAVLTKPLGSRAALQYSLWGKLPLQVWGKLLPRHICERYPFPIGHVFEDLHIIPMYLAAARHVHIVNRPLYRYATRPGSISHPLSTTPRTIDDLIFAINTFHQTTRHLFAADLARHQELNDALTMYETLLYVRVHSLCHMLPKQDQPACRHIDRRAIAATRSHVCTALRNRHAPLSQRLRIVLLALCPPLHDAIMSTHNHFIHVRDA